MKYEKLFTPGRIGNVTIKNRIALPPMGTNIASLNGEASDEIIEYYKARAKGGCGLIFTECTCIDEASGAEGFWQLYATDYRFTQRLRKLAETVHSYDTKIFLQLHHPGRQIAASLQKSGEVVAPSAIPCNVVNEMPRELTTEECEALIRNFVKGAYFAKVAGMDGVELHAAHGYLLNEFLSPYTNKRTDKYGGDFEGRMRFITEIVLGIRQTVGPQFPISVRLTAEEFIPGGFTIEDGVKISMYLEKIGVSSINISCGTYESGYTIVEPYFMAEGWKKHLAKAVKEHVSIPVIAVNTIKHPETAEALLEEGVCDFVAIGRGQLIDPEFSNKARSRQEHLIRHCMGCMYCFKSVFTGYPLICNGNPNLGKETIYNEDTLQKDGAGRTVAIIGGGPGGMQAAYVLAKRGFHSVIFEKTERLGGTMNYAKLPSHKELIGELVETLENEIKSVGVEVRLGTEATVEAVKALDPYGVIVAAGAEPFIVPVPGHDLPTVYKAQDVIAGRHTLDGKHVVIVGAGVTGLETAEMLGGKNKVTVVEMTQNVGELLYTSVRMILLKKLGELGVNILKGTAVQEIQVGNVTVRNTATNEVSTLDADAVVFASGVKQNKELTDHFYTAFDHVTTVGDASVSGLIGDALREANSKAYVF